MNQNQLLLRIILAGCALYCAKRYATEQYFVRTLAGSPQGSFSGVSDGSLTEARFKFPRGIVVDATGNVYVAEESAIRKISTTGNVSTLAGIDGLTGDYNGLGGYARFLDLEALALDPTGNIVGAAAGALRRVTPQGLVTTINGPFEPFPIGTLFNKGVAIDAQGNIFFISMHAIYVRPPGGPSVVFAGGSTIGSADGQGSLASFFFPAGLALDPSGNLFVTDALNNTIRKITPSGLVSTIAGINRVAGSLDGPVASATLNSPFGIAIDGTGTIYFSESTGCTIRKLTPQGIVSTVAGKSGVKGAVDGTGSAAVFNSPQSIAVDSSGTVFVADTFNNLIRKVSPAGVVTTLGGLPIGTPTSVDGLRSAVRFNNPQNLAVTPAGIAYISDTGNHTIRKIALDGTVTTLAGQAGVAGSLDGMGTAAQFNSPEQPVVDNLGNIYVADTNNNLIRKITPDGLVTTLAGTRGKSGSTNGPVATALFYIPEGIAIDPVGNIYVSERTGGVRKITPSGVVSSFYLPPSGTYIRLSSLSADLNGNVYVASELNNICKITPDGTFSVLAGTGASGYQDGAAGTAQFSIPQGIAIDNAGNVFVADSGNNAIRKISPDGVVSTIAGIASNLLTITAASNFSTTGNNDGPGNKATYNSPTGIAVDAQGSLYIVDSGNNTIRLATMVPTGVAAIDSPVGPVNQPRSLDVMPATASGFKWSIVRRPPNSSATIANAAARNPTFKPDANDTYVFQVEATETVGYTLSTVLLTAIDASTNNNAGLTSQIHISRNPARTQSPITFTADTATANIKPTFEWYFYLNGTDQDGPSLPGNPVTRAFSIDGTYSAIVVVSDIYFKIAEIKTFTVSLAPNSGSMALNVFNEGAPSNGFTNPINMLGLQIFDSLGGVLHIDTQPALPDPAASYSYMIDGAPITVNGLLGLTPQFTAQKFTTSGIKVIQVDTVQSGIAQRARLMVPISKPETGEPLPATDMRLTKQSLRSLVSGKLFLNNTSSIQFSDVIEISAGLLITDMTDIEFGVSNFHTKISIDAKGNVTNGPDNAHFSKIRVLLPKFDRLTHRTAQGSVMTINFTLTGTGKELAENGLGTDGVVPVQHPVKGTKLQRTLQFAAIVAGMTYQSNLRILYTPNSDFGNIVGRR